MSLQAGWNKIFHFFLGLTTDFFFFSIDSRFLKPRPSISLLSLFPSQRSRQPLHTPPLGCARTSQLSGVDGVRGPMRAFAVDRKKRSLPWNEEALGWARRRQWHSTPLPGESHEWRGLVGCSPWGREESDTTERLHFHFSLSWIGEGNGNPLQCSCLENPRDGGAWWAAVCGVAQSRTRLKRLSSSSRLSNDKAWEEETNYFHPR